MTGVDGAVLVAAVAFLGSALLVLARRLGVARERLVAAARHAELARRAADAEGARAEQEARAAERRVDDLAEVRASVRAILERAEMARELYAAEAA